MLTVRDLLERETFFDAAILRHGFVDYMRDYELLVSARDGPPNTDIHRYLFVGCVEATFETKVVNAAWFSDAFVFAGPDYPDKDEPDGFIWGVRHADAYPGLTYLDRGPRAAHWSEKLARPMHEVRLETNAYVLRLVFADIRYAYMGREGENLPPRSKDYPIPVVDANRTSDGAVS